MITPHVTMHLDTLSHKHIKTQTFVNPIELQSRSTSSPPTLPSGTGIAILNQRSTSSRLASLPTNPVTHRFADRSKRS